MVDIKKPMYKYNWQKTKTKEVWFVSVTHSFNDNIAIKFEKLYKTDTYILNEKFYVNHKN